MTAFNFELARHNMIEQQIRPWDVLDQRVLDTLRGVPREDFVPERYRNLAFSDVAIPLGHGEVMLKPNVEGRILQALAVQPTDHILEIFNVTRVDQPGQSLGREAIEKVAPVFENGHFVVPRIIES